MFSIGEAPNGGLVLSQKRLLGAFVLGHHSPYFLSYTYVPLSFP